MDDNTERPQRNVFEEIEVAGSQLIEKIKEVIRQGNIRKLKVHAGDDFTLEMPITVGALAGGAVVLAAPWLAVIGVIAATVAQVKIEVEREPEAAPEAEPSETDRATDA
ncbi:MAG: DUF4342 domain-containing protein [Paracoccaceae bacterium]